MRHVPFSFWGKVAAPTISSLNYAQGDTSGGGQTITVTGTNLSGGTVDIGGTSQTVTGTGPTSINFTLVTKAAGTYTLTVTTGGGTATTSFEYWAPDSDAGCTLFCDANYTSANAHTNGTWTARLGTSPTTTSGAPNASGGVPVWDGVSALVGGTVGSVFDFVAACNMSFFAVLSASAAATHDGVSLIENPGLFGDGGRGAVGAMFDSAGFSLVATDGSYKISSTAMAADGNKHVGICRFSDGTSLETRVDSSGWTSTAFGTFNTSTTPSLVIGENYGTKKLNNATTYAIGCYQTKIADAIGTKIYKWAQQKWGVA